LLLSRSGGTHEHRSSEIVEDAAHGLAEHFHIRQPSRSAPAVRLRCPAYDSTAATSVKLPMTDTTFAEDASKIAPTPLGFDDRSGTRPDAAVGA
jgi:hypothetical protein